MGAVDSGGWEGSRDTVVMRWRKMRFVAVRGHAEEAEEP